MVELEGEESKMREDNKIVDKQVSSLMKENQQLEAHKANLEHALSNIDEDIAAQKRRLDSQERQMKKLENDDIPPVEVEITSLKGQLKALEEEMGTELSETITSEEKSMLKQLKAVQDEHDTNIQMQIQVLEDIGVERQRLVSLLEDNLLKRKQELENDGATSSSRRRSMDGQTASNIAQDERKVDLEQLRRELNEAIGNADDVEKRLSEAKQLDEDLHSELVDAKKRLDKLRASDVELAKEMEDAKKREEKLMNRVSKEFYFQASFVSFMMTSHNTTANAISNSTRSKCKENPRNWISAIDQRVIKEQIIFNFSADEGT